MLLRTSKKNYEKEINHNVLEIESEFWYAVRNKSKYICMREGA